LSMDIFQCQLSNWITSLPRYIKDCLHISVCESWEHYLYRRN